MKVLEKINIEDVVSIDIETVRVADSFENLDEGTKSAWEYKNKQDGEIPSYEDLSSLWERNSSLYAEFSKICAASLVFLHNNKLFCREFYGEDEKEILENLSVTLNNIANKGSQYRLVGHAAKYFDYPFLAKRYLINQLEIPTLLDVTDLKPWEQKNLCTNELWKLGGTGAGSSLQALCNVLSIPISKVDLVGDEVGKAYYNGEIERVGRYCSYDAIATFNVIRRFKQQPIFLFEDVEYLVLKEKEEKKPIIQTLYDNKDISGKDKEELKKILSKKKKTKKEKETLQNMLVALVTKSDFDNKDSKEEIQRKQKEIEEFLNSL